MKIEFQSKLKLNTKRTRENVPGKIRNQKLRRRKNQEEREQKCFNVIKCEERFRAERI